MSCCTSSLYESRPLRASSALPGTPPGEQHRCITQRHRLINAPQRGGERRCRAHGPPGGEQKMRPRRRAKTVRGGTAFPPVPLRLRLRSGLDPPCGPAAPRSAIRRSAPPGLLSKKRPGSAPLRSGKGKQAPRLARRPKARRSGMRLGGR